MCLIVKLPRMGEGGHVYHSSASSAASSTSSFDKFPERPVKRPPKYYCLFHGCFFACPKKEILQRHVDEAHAKMLLAQQNKRKRHDSETSLSLPPEHFPAPVLPPPPQPAHHYRSAKAEHIGNAMMVENWQQPPMRLKLNRPPPPVSKPIMLSHNPYFRGSEKPVPKRRQSGFFHGNRAMWAAPRPAFSA